MAIAGTLLRTSIFMAAAVLWIAGLRLFLRSSLTTRRKLIWSGVLLVVGAAVGLILPHDAIFRRFVLLIAALPILAAVDLFILRSGRTFSFWVRACGFEICTVFAAAFVARWILDYAGIAALRAGSASAARTAALRCAQLETIAANGVAACSAPP
jgi:hypothetical protein